MPRSTREVALELMWAVHRYYNDSGQLLSAITVAGRISELTGRPADSFSEVFRETFGS